MWAGISSMPLCQHSRAPGFRVALLLATTGPNSSAAVRCPLRLPVYELCRRKHLASLLASRAPGPALSRCHGRHGRAVLCASSATDSLLHSKYDKQILGLAVPALFSIILVRPASELVLPRVVWQLLSLGLWNLHRTPL